MLSVIAHLTSLAFVCWLVACTLHYAAEDSRARPGWGRRLAVLAALGAVTGGFLLLK